MEPPPGLAAREAFRPDIEGLRGVAVLLVVLFHAGVVGIPGGFIGVDVFFVISGFLITGLLIRERERTGVIRLRAFYARRVRRLLPAGVTVLAVTLVASFVMLNPLDRESAALDAAAAALSIGNVRFAMAAGDYFASVASPSPFLHYWSLAVEEQFYLVWPALILVAARAGRPRVAAAAALALVVTTSFLANLAVTDQAPGWAFYSLPTRAWQLAAGGLLALLTRRPTGPVRWLVAAAGWLGLAAIGVAAVVLDSSVAYPGLPALIPTLAAVAVVLAGGVPFGPGRLLAVSPLRFLGRISYSLYLWHWPILVLPAALAGADLPPTERLDLVLASVIVAWASWRWIEEPFRTGFPALARHPVRTVLAGGLAIAVVVTSAGGLVLAGSRELVDPADSGPVAALEAMASPAATEAPPGASVDSGGLPWSNLPDGSGEADASAVPDASPAPTSAPTPMPTPRLSIRLPADVQPPLATARSDEERLRRDGCLAFEAATRPADHCVYGVADASFTVALVGDSHASQWFPALELIAQARGWRLLPFVKVACPFLDIPTINIALKREYRECEAFDNAVIDRLDQVQPDLTLVSMSRYAIHPVLPRDQAITAQSASFARMLERVPGRVAVIMDTPDGGQDIPACLAVHTADVRACAIPLPVAFALNLGDLERNAVQAAGAELIDMTSAVCRGDPCPVVVDDMIVFRDLRHLTATYSASLAPILDEALVRILSTPALSPG